MVNSFTCDLTRWDVEYRYILTSFDVSLLANQMVLFCEIKILQASAEIAGYDVIGVVIPLKDQESANLVKTQLKDRSLKFHNTVQPVFVSKKIGQDLHECETKPQLVNQQCVVHQFQCNLCDTGSFVGYTRGHVLTRVDGYKSKSSSLRKQCDKDHTGTAPEDLRSCFRPGTNIES